MCEPEREEGSDPARPRELASGSSPPRSPFWKYALPVLVHIDGSTNRTSVNRMLSIWMPSLGYAVMQIEIASWEGCRARSYRSSRFPSGDTATRRAVPMLGYSIRYIHRFVLALPASGAGACCRSRQLFHRAPLDRRQTQLHVCGTVRPAFTASRSPRGMHACTTFIICEANIKLPLPT